MLNLSWLCTTTTCQQCLEFWGTQYRCFFAINFLLIPFHKYGVSFLYNCDKISFVGLTPVLTFRRICLTFLYVFEGDKQFLLFIVTITTFALNARLTLAPDFMATPVSRTTLFFFFFTGYAPVIHFLFGCLNFANVLRFFLCFNFSNFWIWQLFLWPFPDLE